jgi:hypothetical protein
MSSDPQVENMTLLKGSMEKERINGQFRDLTKGAPRTTFEITDGLLIR